MARGSLSYSANACDVVTLFRRTQFRLLTGGVEKDVEPALAEQVASTVVATYKHVGGSSVQVTSFIQSRKQRVPGLNRGTLKISEDFNDPLPDEFWLGIE